MSDYKFQTTIDPKKLTELFAVCGTEWGGVLSPEQFGQNECKKFVEFILSGKVGRAYYLETKGGEIAAIALISQRKGLYKDVSRSNGYSIPDPSGFGVNSITGIRLGHVFTNKAYRGKGLMQRLVKKVIEHTEEEILKRELAKSDSKKDSFKQMVTSDGKVDKLLANYYLSKRYVWYLYSAIGSAYKRFGFKEYPVDGYKIPFSLATGETHGLLAKMISGAAPEHVVGKKIRFLDGKSQQDLDLIEFILQGRELDLLSELSKTQFHLELTGTLKLSSSLTNIQSALSVQKLGSSNELSAISEQLDSTKISPLTPDGATKRRLLVQHFHIPKFALKMDIGNLMHNYTNESLVASKDPESAPYGDLRGAILTNELQQKTFYILWTEIMGDEFQIVGLGELKADLFGALADPAGFTNAVGRRRGSSFTGLNEMGGFNFQDLDILVNAAVYVAQKRKNLRKVVYVTSNDLPLTIPAPVLHDFFMNYLTSHEAQADQTVEYIENFLDECKMLPMLKAYGSSSPEFDLDWTGSSMVSWG